MAKKRAKNSPQNQSQELSDKELADVAGGVTIGLSSPPEPDTNAAGESVTSPRDPASGLPTGQRMHKPY